MALLLLALIAGALALAPPPDRTTLLYVREQGRSDARMNELYDFVSGNRAAFNAVAIEFGFLSNASLGLYTTAPGATQSVASFTARFQRLGGMQTFAYILGSCPTCGLPRIETIRAVMEKPGPFVKATVAGALSLGFDGIALDFEPGDCNKTKGVAPCTQADGANFVAFLKTLGAALAAHGLQLQVYVEGWEPVVILQRTFLD